MNLHLNHTDTQAIHSVQLSMSMEQRTADSVRAVNTDIGWWLDSAQKVATLDLSLFLEVLPALSKY